MLIAHLPAGYIVTRVFIQKFSSEYQRDKTDLWIAGLLFSVIPDIDLLYFYLIDSSVHHHRYFPHIPSFWLLFFLIAYSFSKLVGNKNTNMLILLCLVNILVHLVLDSFVGYVWWFYPFYDEPFCLVEIPDRYGHWIINFILHWSFIVELLIVCIAIILSKASKK